MGEFKEGSIPDREDEDWDLPPDFWADEEPMSERDVEGLRAQVILDEVMGIQAWLLKKMDRMRYYNETVTKEEIEFLLSETHRIIRDLGT